MKKRRMLISLLCATAVLGLSGVVLSGCDNKNDPKTETPEVQKFNVTIDLNDGSETTIQEVAQGQKLTGVAEPTREGYHFAGWKVNGTAWTMDEEITADITIVAQWDPISYCTVTIDLNDGSNVTTKKVEQGQKLTGVAEPTREGYTFAGWKVDGTAWTMDEEITADITIVAQWTEKSTPVEHTVTIHYCDEKTENGTLSVEKDALITTEDLPNPTREGYQFIGWYQDESYGEDWNIEEDTVQQDLDLYAKWEKLFLISQAAVDSLKTSIYIDGSYVYTSEHFGEDKAGIVTIFEPTAVKVMEYDLTTNEELYLMEIVDYNGNCAFVSHSIQNEVSFNDLKQPFDDYDNPFTDLAIADFAHVRDNVFSIVDDGNGNLKAIASCITGWDEEIKSILVTVEEDKIVDITIETNEMSKNVTIDNETTKDKYSVVYTFEIKEHGTAKTGIIVGPYERVPEHDALEAALKKMNHNHTIHCLDVAPGYEDVSYDILVNDTVTYDNYDNDGTTYGYIELDGYVYSFVYSEGKVTVGDPLYKGSIALTSSNFTAFKPEVMEYIGNNTFRAYNTELAQEILSYIGPDYDRQRLGGDYASYVEIEIKDGYVYKVTFDYSAYGAVGTLTLTYDSFDTTTIDIDFSNIEHTSVLDPYMGTWKTTEAGGHTIVVNDSGIFVDDAEFKVTDYDKTNGFFTGTINDEVYYLRLMTERDIAFFNETNTVFWIFQNTALVQELVTVPDELKGVWVTEDESMKITIQTHAVFINGSSVELVYYSEKDQVLTVTYNNGSYYLFIDTDEETGDTYLYLSKNDLTDKHMLSKTAESIGIEIPTSYIGIWTNEEDGIRIVIRYSGITINGKDYVITSYDKGSGFVGTLGNVTDYMIAPYFTADKLQVGTMADNAVVTQISNNPKDEDTKIYEEHIGYYEGSAEDGSAYKVSITADGITINEEKYVITQSTDVSYDGLWHDEVWYIIYSYDNYIELMNTGGTYIKCTLTEAPLPSVTIQSAHIGTYEGTKADVTYTIVVTAEAITINGTAYTLTAYDEIDGYTGTWNNEKFYLSYIDYTDPVQMMLFNEGYIINVICKPKSETPTPAPEVQAEHVGTYVGTKDNVTYTIVVTAEGITINDTAYTITAYDEVDGYTGTWNNEEFYLSYMDYTDPVQMMLCNEGSTINVICKPKSETPTPAPEVQAEHVGTYVGTNADVTYTIVVTAEGITINGTAYTITSYDSYEGYIGTWNDVEWCLGYYAATDSDPAYMMLMNMADKIYVTCNLQSDTPITPEVQAEHVGTYVGTNADVTYTIVVTAEAVTINDTAVTLISYVTEGYEAYYMVEWEQANWKMSYVGAWSSYPAAFVLSKDTIEITCDLQSATTPEVQTAHIGTYVGTNADVTYTIVITADGITINDTAYTITAYSDYEGYTGTWEGAEWYIQTDNSNMRLLNSNFSIRVSCAPQGATPTTPEVQA